MKGHTTASESDLSLKLPPPCSTVGTMILVARLFQRKRRAIVTALTSAAAVPQKGNIKVREYTGGADGTDMTGRGCDDIYKQINQP